MQYARATCAMLHSHLLTDYVVEDLAEHFGGGWSSATTRQLADQVMDGAMIADCPNLTIGDDGIARAGR